MAKGDKCRLVGCSKIVNVKGRTVCCAHRKRMSVHGSYDKPKSTKINKFSEEIVKVCKLHGNLTENDVYIWQGIRTRTRNKKGVPFTCKNKTIKCRKCANRLTANWQNKDIERRNKYQRKIQKINYPSQGRWAWIKRKYGLSEDDYEDLLKKQNYVCAICKQRETIIEGNSQRLKPLCIDHCHKTGKIRGLLCNRCNPMIGYSQDSIETHLSAIEYLKAHQ